MFIISSRPISGERCSTSARKPSVRDCYIDKDWYLKGQDPRRGWLLLRTWGIGQEDRRGWILQPGIKGIIERCIYDYFRYERYVCWCKNKVIPAPFPVPPTRRCSTEGGRLTQSSDIFPCAIYFSHLQGAIVSDKRKADQKIVDAEIMAKVSAEPLLKEYLSAMFSLKNGDRPHEMLF